MQRPTIPGWAIPLLFLCGVLFVFALGTIRAFAADDPQATIAFQAQAIKALQDQRNACMDQSANVQANATVLIERLQKRVAELEEAAKPKK